MIPLRAEDKREDERHWHGILAAAASGVVPERLKVGALWQIYGPLVEAACSDRPCVIGQIGQSLDGRIATAAGQSRYINGHDALVHLHRLRALVDGVVIGVGTAVADDPQLTVRLAEGADPARVVIDPSGRLPETCRCLGDDGVRRIVIQNGNRVRPQGVEPINLGSESGVIPPKRIVEALAERGLRRILIEGGGATVSQFLGSGCLDRLHVLVAPMIIGSGPIGIRLDEIDELSEAIRPKVVVSTFAEGDLLFDCDLKPKGRLG